jgi:membrane protease YdiL (CAAX protease family)
MRKIIAALAARTTPAAKSVIRAIGLVLCVYVVFPSGVAWIGTFTLTGLAALRNGIGFLDTPSAQKYVLNLEAFLGELTLLIGSGLLAVWICGRGVTLGLGGTRRRWREVLIGLGLAVINYEIGKRIILPWLYLARPIGMQWIKPEYYSITEYGRSYMSQVAAVFFIDSVYVPVVETFAFTAFMYGALRLQWGRAVSLLVASVIFAAIHRNELLFLDFALFGFVNFALFEFRKSLVAPLFHHLIFNALVYGSQLGVF